jgi:hypothetical protein
MNPVIFRDVRVTTGQGHEPRAKVVDGAVTLEKSELTNRVISERRPKPDLNELDEMIPQWRPAVELQSVVPHLGIV